MALFNTSMFSPEQENWLMSVLAPGALDQHQGTSTQAKPSFAERFSPTFGIPQPTEQQRTSLLQPFVQPNAPAADVPLPPSRPVTQEMSAQPIQPAPYFPPQQQLPPEATGSVAEQSQIGPMAALNIGAGQGASLPQNAQPTQGQMPQQQPQSSGPGMMDRLSAGAANLSSGGNPISMLLNTITGLGTGQRFDRQGMALQQRQATFDALRQSGVPVPIAQAAALNPEILKTIAPNYFDTKPKFGVIGQNQMGVNQYGFIRENQGTVTPVNPQGGAPGSAGDIDPSLTGEAFLAAIAANPSLGPGKAQMVKAIAEGRQPYPSGFIMKTPFGQWLTSAVGQYEPGLDATKIGQRATFNRQLGSAAPSSVGGQKTLMGTSLGHLSEVAEAAADLGNVNGLGIAPLAHLTNATRGLSTEQAAKINKLNETVDRFSGEVGKLYSGSAGGGVQERDQTRSRFGGSRSAEELAAGLEASRGLIQSKLAALENQQDQIFGPESKGRIDFLGDNGREALKKIDAAIAKLRGMSTANSNSSGTTKSGIKWSVQ